MVVSYLFLESSKSDLVNNQICWFSIHDTNDKSIHYILMSDSLLSSQLIVQEGAWSAQMSVVIM